MTANTASAPQDYSSFMQEIAQLRKEIAEAKQQQSGSFTQPQQQLGSQSMGAGAGAGASCNQKARKGWYG